MSSKLSIPNKTYKGYETKVSRLIEIINEGFHDCAIYNYDDNHYYWEKRPITRDGIWMKLGELENVGAKMLVWMVQRRFLIRRRGVGMSVPAIINDWYRFPESESNVDLGDLWLE